jgi:hypothetical protein
LTLAIIFNDVEIDISDLPALLSNWVGHVISMLGAGDRPAAPFHSHRIYTLLYTDPSWLTAATHPFQ